MGVKYQIVCTCGHRMSASKHDFGRAVMCPMCNHMLTISNDSVSPWEDTTPAPKVSTPLTDAPRIEWQPGNVILGLYEVRSLLGQGGMGAVYRVYHRAWRVELAVKCPKERLLARAGGIENFERECETWINLGLHPNTTTCYYVRRIDGLPRIFAEYVSGGSLLDWIKSGRLYTNDPLKNLERILRIGIHVAWGLHFAHEQGVVHRDVKAGNVLLTPTGVAKVTDFGLAKAVVTPNAQDKEDATEAANPDQPVLVSIAGMTPAYCAPEQVHGGTITRATDIWSWGFCLLEMLAGRVFWRFGTDGPVACQHLIRHAPKITRTQGIPPALGELLTECFSVDPTGRPKDIDIVATRLQQIYAETIGRPFAWRTPKLIMARAESLNNRGVSLLDLGKKDEARRCWIEATKASPQHPDATFNLGLMEWRDAAITDDAFLHRLRQVVQTHAAEPWPLYLLALAHLERGAWSDAAPLLEEASHVPGLGEAATSFLSAIHTRILDARRPLRLWTEHVDLVNAVQFLPGGDCALSCSADNTIRLWDLVTGKLAGKFEGHGGSVRGAAIHPDGNRLFTVSEDRTLRVWDLASGTAISASAALESPLTSVIIGEHGRMAVAGAADGSLALWRTDFHRAARVFQGYGGPINALAVSLDTESAISASDDGCIRFWRLPAGNMGTRFQAHEGPVLCLTMSQGGTLFSGGADGVIRAWNGESGECTAEFSGARGAVTSIAVAPDGQTVIAGEAEGAVRIWETGTGRARCTFTDHHNAVRAVAVDSDGRKALSGGEDKTVRLWSLGQPQLQYPAAYLLSRATDSEHAASMAAQFADAINTARKAFAQGAMHQAAASIRRARGLAGFARNAEAMDLWFLLYSRLPREELANTWEWHEFTGHTGAIKALALTPNARRLLSLSDDRTFRIWDMVAGKPLATLEGHGSPPTSLSLSEDGRWALSSDTGGALMLWDIEHGRLERPFKDLGVSVDAAILSPDGRFAVAVGWEISLWAASTGRRVRIFPRRGEGTVSAALSRDGRMLFTGGSEGQVDAWDLVRGRWLRSFTGHEGSVRRLMVSPRGDLLVSISAAPWSTAANLRIWDVNSGTCRASLECTTAHTAWLTDDQRYLLTGDGLSSLRLISFDGGGRVIRSFESRSGSIEAACIARDNRVIAAGGKSGAIETWALDWALAERPPASWDPKAQPILDTFVHAHMAPGANWPTGERAPSEADVVRILTRRGTPSWTDTDLDSLFYALGCAGFAGIAREEVLAQLDKTSRKSRLSSWLPF